MTDTGRSEGGKAGRAGMSYEPKTYLEKRCMIAENVLDAFMEMMVATMTPEQVNGWQKLTNKWQDTLDNLDLDGEQP
jgi:hypothetical protein